MPNGDHQKSTQQEKEMSKVVALLDELHTGEPVDQENYGSGYDARVYNKPANTDLIDTLVDKLNKLTGLDVSRYSLELQMWWRDYQTKEQVRKKEIQDRLTCVADRQAALSKLSQPERDLLNL